MNHALLVFRMRADDEQNGNGPGRFVNQTTADADGHFGRRPANDAAFGRRGIAEGFPGRTKGMAEKGHSGNFKIDAFPARSMGCLPYMSRFDGPDNLLVVRVRSCAQEARETVYGIESYVLPVACGHPDNELSGPSNFRCLQVHEKFVEGSGFLECGEERLPQTREGTTRPYAAIPVETGIGMAPGRRSG